MDKVILQNFLNTMEILVLNYAVGQVAHDAKTTWTATRNAIETAAIDGALSDISNHLHSMINGSVTTSSEGK